MPLPEPPLAAGSLATIPAQPLRGRTLHRVWRVSSPPRDPWWFSSTPDEPADGGRFDLRAPMGSCYLATTAVGALLEALQMVLTNLPRGELALRRRAEVTAPEAAPPAARLTARIVAGRHGITAAMWAGRDRALTQRWAAALRRDGWWALYSGLSHDPSGRLRSVALFDHAGAHAPTVGGTWVYTVATLDGDEPLITSLARYGVAVRDPGVLPWAELPGDA